METLVSSGDATGTDSKTLSCKILPPGRFEVSSSVKMRTNSLPKDRTSMEETQTSRSDFPSPLHIIKRTKTIEFRSDPKRDASNGSVDCGPDRPLSVTKKRQNSQTGAVALKSDCPSVLQPISQAQPRWFSRRRTSSSGTTFRRRSLRGSSISSNESSIRSSDLRLIDAASTPDPFRTSGSTQSSVSFSRSPTPAEHNDDCHILVPHISITPEVQASNNTLSTVWATIEISAQLSSPCADDTPPLPLDASFLSSIRPRAGSVSRFGYLYNLQVDVLPVPKSAVIQIIRGDESGSLSLGSSKLLLAKVRIDCRRPRRSNRTTTHMSNELIAELESELGAPSVKYLQVRLRYQHSGFLAPIGCQTQLETTTTAVIEQQSLQLPFNSSPSSTRNSSLYPIVASYWPLRANEIFCPKKARRTKRLPMADEHLVSNYRGIMSAECLSYQPTATGFDPSTPVPRRPLQIRTSPLDENEDPARKIWTEMRFNSSRRRHINAENASTLALPPTMPPTMSTSMREQTNASSLRMKTDVDRQRELIYGTALRNKRSIGADSLRSLVPSIMNLNVGGGSRDSWGGSPSGISNKENVPPDSRKEVRWNIAGWWGGQAECSD